MTDVRAQAARDFQQLQRAGYVVRDDLRPEVVRAWRSAIIGRAHAAGFKADTGVIGKSGAWASINPESPDMARW